MVVTAIILTLTFLLVGVLGMSGAQLAGGSAQSYGAAVTQVAPSGFAAVQGDDTCVQFSWKPATNASGYQLYIDEGNGTFKWMASVFNGKQTSYTSKKLTAGKTYRFRARAFRTVKTGKTSSRIYSRYTVVKTVKVVNAKPTFGITLPTSINTTNRTMTITLANNAKSDKLYIDGAFALEENTQAGAPVHNLQITKYARVADGTGGNLPKGKRLAIEPGEKVRLTCKLDSTSLSYNRSQVRLTVCARYRKQDFVVLYTQSSGNRKYTVAEYYRLLL